MVKNILKKENKGEKTMPNWVEGTFRARGSKENIKKFLQEGLEACYGLKITTEIDENDDSLYVTFKNPEIAENDYKHKYHDTLYIKDTRRNFIEDLCGEIYAYKKKSNGEFQFTSSFKSAWAIDTEPLVNIAEKYEIDIRVNGFERGMEFEQLLEISRKGQIKCESVISYDDWDWQCPMPLLGG